MKENSRGSGCSQVRCNQLAYAIAIVGLLIFVMDGLAEVPLPGGTNSGPAFTVLDTWSFSNFTNWTSDKADAPLSFTNLTWSYLGISPSLVVDSTNPAWLQYAVSDSHVTNLTVNSGTVMFWFAPSSWSSTNAGGNGPGESGRLLEVGGYSPDSSFGWWSVYVDTNGNNLYFSAQTNDLSGTVTTYLAWPISWVTNYFHHVALTYCATNTALYLDGSLATNGPPLTVYPGANALANGMFIGSDSNGVYQAHGMFSSVATYHTNLDATTIQAMYIGQLEYMQINPWNRVMFTLTNATSYPSWTNGYNAITGIGNLQWTGSASACTYGADAYQVWFTNTTALTTNGATSLTFTIAGGEPGYNYDVFATGALQNPVTNSIWVWLGQGQTCNTYTVNVISQNALFMMGTPTNSCGCGLSDAYMSLVAKVSPDGPQFDGYGVPYAWYAQNGLVSITAGMATNDPDGDGLLNYQEYQYGTKPQVSEGFSIWVGSVNGTTVIP